MVHISCTIILVLTASLTDKFIKRTMASRYLPKTTFTCGIDYNWRQSAITDTRPKCHL